MLTLLFVVVEVVSGWFSLALLWTPENNLAAAVDRDDLFR